jgi:hypothetical protein
MFYKMNTVDPPVPTGLTYEQLGLRQKIFSFVFTTKVLSYDPHAGQGHLSYDPHGIHKL